MSSQYSPRFWDKYIDKTISYGVRPHQSRWYVRHVEAFFKAHSGGAQTHHDAEFVTAYLEQKGRDKRLETWQFRQMVIALKILFLEMLKPAWAVSYPWDEYADFARGLGDNHATVARDYVPDTGDPIPALQEKNDVDKESLHKRVHSLYPQYIDSLIRQIRAKRYSIRTGQAYLGWLIRYIAFHQMKDPAALSDESIAAFLDHLVHKRKVAASTQMQALNALVFFSRQVLQRKPGEAIEFTLAIICMNRYCRSKSSRPSNGPLSEKKFVPRAAPLFRDAAAGKRLRHPHSTGIAGTFRCVDDDDLHPRSESARGYRHQSDRYA